MIIRKLSPLILLAALTGLGQVAPMHSRILRPAELHVLPVQGNTYMMVGPGGNITIQTGKDGVLLVDTMFAPLAQRIAAEIKKLSRPAHPLHHRHPRPRRSCRRQRAAAENGRRRSLASDGRRAHGHRA